MSKTLEKRLKVLEMRNGKITITEPALTPEELAVLRENAVQAMANNYFNFVAKRQPSTLELEEYKAQAREACRKAEAEVKHEDVGHR